MKKILIDAGQKDEVRVAIVDGEGLVDYETEKLKMIELREIFILLKL